MSLIPKGMPISKRLFDLLGAGLGLIVIGPFLLIIAVMIWVRTGLPILFRQVRPGYREKPFGLLKFRTMNEARDRSGVLLVDGERVTGLGRTLRSFSLDELPELINVLRGEMSLVGPRPLLLAYLSRYSAEERRRHSVLPGITGWAQVNGRNALTWPEKFAYDLWYVDHWSFGLDLKILALTLWKAVRREGVRPPGQETSDEFMGTENEPKSPSGGPSAP